MRNRTTLGILCIAASLLLCFVVAPFINSGMSAKVKIVRMKSDAKAGDRISSGMLEEVEVGKYNLPDDVIASEDDAVGKYLTADVLAGDYLLPGKVTDEPERENEYLYGLDGKKQAMSITIKDFAEGVSGKLKSGDVVSVIVPNFQKTGKTVIPTELKYVEVIAVTAKSGNDANLEGKRTEDDEENKKELPSTVTVLVTPLQSRILAMLEEGDEMHLSLVYRGGKANVKKFIDEQDKALAEIEELLNKAAQEKEKEGTEYKSVGADGTVIISSYLGTGRTNLISEGNRIATSELPATAALGTDDVKKAGELLRNSEE